MKGRYAILWQQYNYAPELCETQVGFNFHIVFLEASMVTPALELILRACQKLSVMLSHNQQCTSRKLTPSLAQHLQTPSHSHGKQGRTFPRLTLRIPTRQNSELVNHSVL